MGQALYRQYRSKSFSDVLGQEHITETLENAIKTGKLSHAYLFTGPRGVGKTSVARILAHEVNGLDYPSKTIQLDIIEIDAASNRRIDEIRELRDKVHIAPTSAKYKVYIIDEVHMLTKEAFNALLKTLEEPPAHCIFILATTEAHKVPETITSRTQKFTFKSITKDHAVARLKDISKAEKIDITPGALELLAEHGEGSFRDSISMLDQLAGSGRKIDEAVVKSILGLPEDMLIKKLIASISNGDSVELLSQLEQLSRQAVSSQDIARAISKQLRTSALSEPLAIWQVGLLKSLLGVSTQQNGSFESLEIALLEASQNAQSTQSVGLNAAVPPSIQIPQEELPAAQPTAESLQPNMQKPKVVRKIGSFSLDDWPEVLNRVKNQAASLYTALRLAKPELHGDRLELVFQFPLHQKKLNTAAAKDVIGEIIEAMGGGKIQIECTVSTSLLPKVSYETKPQTPDSVESLQSISSIFGGAEVLESEATI